MKETLRNLRTQNHYSQSFVATYLGVSRQMYIRYENGEVEPPVKFVVALAKLYSVSYDVFLENKFYDSKIDLTKSENLKTGENITTEEDKDFFAFSDMDLQDDNPDVSFIPETILGLFEKLSFPNQMVVFSKITDVIKNKTLRQCQKINQNKKK